MDEDNVKGERDKTNNERKQEKETARENYREKGKKKRKIKIREVLSSNTDEEKED